MHTLKGAKRSHIHQGICAALAAVVSVSMLIGLSAPAGPQDAGTADASALADNARRLLAPSRNADARAVNLDPAAAQCAAADWSALKDCVAKATGDTLVTITASIAVPRGESIDIDGKTIALTSDIAAATNEAAANVKATNGATVSAFTIAADDDPSTALFTVSNGGALIVGKDAKDKSFIYAGAADGSKTRRFARITAKGANGAANSLVINNGTFTRLTGAQALLAWNEGDLTINGGTFSGNVAANADKIVANGGLIYQVNGTTVINNGTFAGNQAERGSVLFSENNANGSSATTINNGTFSGNKANMAAGVMLQDDRDGTLTINNGTFTGNAAGTKGGVIHNNGIMTVTGGTFTGNKAYGNGGGAISEEGNAKLVVKPSDDNVVTFNSNGQTFDDAVLKACNTVTGDTDGCWKNNNDAQHFGGGAIFANEKTDNNVTGYPSVSITGNVVFDGNYANKWGYMLGGGAIFMSGELWVQNDARGNRPTFVNNYAGVRQRETNADGTVKTVLRGGAGGAIFLEEGAMSEGNAKSSSMAYIMGGDFKNNTSGYLGGAIYTESKTVTYVAKAVAYDNVAGHFGGGLWLCPSGTGKASKGGNIALFDNRVDATIDPNNSANGSPYPNDVPYSGTALIKWEQDAAGKWQRVTDTVSGTGTMAGDDFAIMNPMWKQEIDSTDFQLMDTWFTDRVNAAVDWYEDGTPLKAASGFQDYFQDPLIASQGGWHHGEGGGTNLAVTMTGSRYADSDVANRTKVEMDASHMHTIKLTRRISSTDGSLTTGMALKAVVRGATEAEREQTKNAAKKAAAITFTGNAARLSGDAFATNGDVKFSTPYTASWSKTDAADTTKQIAGAQWLLTTEYADVTFHNADNTTSTQHIIGGPYDSAFYPTVCATDEHGATTEAGNIAWESGICWKQSVDASGRITAYSAIINDNIANDATTPTDYSYAGFDNNPDGGGFDINNLANGRYTLTERKAPTGYVPETNPDGTAKAYTFTVANAQGEWSNGIGQNASVDQEIPNTKLSGVSWGKIDADTNDKVPGSVWHVTLIRDAAGNPVTNGTTHTVTDCVDAADATEANKCASKNAGNVFADRDGTAAAGMFNITVDKPGTYKLQESAAPDGYWQPAGDTYYTFTITANGNGDVQLHHADGTTVVAGNNIVNQRPTVSWSKVATDSHTLLAGSQWNVRGPLTKNATTGTLEAISGKTITASVTDCRSTNGYCATQPNVLDGTDKTYQDLDEASGKLRIAGLAPAPDEQTEYWYELTETQAPSGFVTSTVVYTFRVGYRQPNADIRIDAPQGASLPVRHDLDQATIGINAIENVRAVAALPFTGGGTSRDWMIAGGGIAMIAALATAATQIWRRRKALAGTRPTTWGWTR